MDGDCDYAYGVGQRPRGTASYFERSVDGERAMSWQVAEMWERVQRLLDLPERVARKLGVRDPDRVHDVGLRALCYAAVTWVDYEEAGRKRRGQSLERYAQTVVRCALQKRGRRDVSGLDPDQEACPASERARRGLAAADELQALGLEERELDLLYLRFDCELSLEEVADAMGASSRSTAKKHLDRIVARCRASRTTSETRESESESESC